MSELRQSVIVRTREDVAAWAEDLWSQCLNEAARALVGSAAGEYLAMFGAIEAHHRAQEELRAAIEDLALEPDDAVSKALANVAAMRAKACPGEVEVRAKLVPLIVQFVSKAQAANRAEADAAMVQLRKFAAERAKLGEEFGPRRKLEVVKS
jgi:hypothetical protein